MITKLYGHFFNVAAREERTRSFSVSVLHQLALTYLMVYPLKDFLFVVQHNKRLRADGIAIEDETEVATLALHVCEVD